MSYNKLNSFIALNFMTVKCIKIKDNKFNSIECNSIN